MIAKYTIINFVDLTNIYLFYIFGILNIYFILFYKDNGMLIESIINFMDHAFNIICIKHVSVMSISIDCNTFDIS